MLNTNYSDLGKVNWAQFNPTRDPYNSDSPPIRKFPARTRNYAHAAYEPVRAAARVADLSLQSYSSAFAKHPRFHDSFVLFR